MSKTDLLICLCVILLGIGKEVTDIWVDWSNRKIREIDARLRQRDNSSEKQDKGEHGD